MRNNGNAWPRGTVKGRELRFQPQLHGHEWGVLNKGRILLGYVDGTGFVLDEYFEGQKASGWETPEAWSRDLEEFLAGRREAGA